MKKLLSVFALTTILVTNLFATPLNASDLDTVVGEEVIYIESEVPSKREAYQTKYRWVRTGTSKKASSLARKPCVSSTSKAQLTCTAGRMAQVSNTVSGSAQVGLSTGQAFINAGFSRTNTTGYSMSGSGIFHTGNKGATLYYTPKYTTYTATYAKQCYGGIPGGSCYSGWKNTGSTATVVAKGDYYPSFSLVNN